MGVITDATIESPYGGPVAIHFLMCNVSGGEIDLFETAMLSRFSLDIDIGMGPMKIQPIAVRVTNQIDPPFGNTRNLEVSGLVGP